MTSVTKTSHKQDAPTPFLFGLAGWSGSGKTTLAEKLITHATKSGIIIASIKHAHHNFDADIEGKDSWRHRKAGAGQVIVASDQRIAHFTEHRTPTQPILDELLGRLTACDWVLVEGFKKEPMPKLEIYDPALAQTPLYSQDSTIMAVIGQEIPEDCPLPYFDRNDIKGIFGFLCEQARQTLS